MAEYNFRFLTEIDSVQLIASGTGVNTSVSALLRQWIDERLDSPLPA